MKNRYLPKEPVPLPQLGGEVGGAPSLAGLLLEFLYIEHHAKLQAALAHFAMPSERRVASGQSILVEPSKTVTAAPAACDDIDRFGHELRLAGREEAAE